jgi:hypothetical protein
VCGEGDNPYPNPYRGFVSAEFPINDVSYVTKRLGRVFHSDIERLNFHANSITSMEPGWAAHLTKMYCYGHPINGIKVIPVGWSQGMESMENIWTYALNDVTHYDEHWWWSGENITKGKGFPQLRWFATPIMVSLDHIEEDWCCKDFPELRLLDFGFTAIAEVHAKMFERLTHLAKMNMNTMALTKLPKDFMKAQDDYGIFVFDLSHNNILEIEPGGVPNRLDQVVRYKMAGNPSRCFPGVNLETGTLSTTVTCVCGPGYYADGEQSCVKARCPETVSFPQFATNFNKGAINDCSSNGTSSIIAPENRNQNTTCKVTCPSPYEGEMTYVCGTDGQWAPKSGRILECLKVHNSETVYGTPETPMQFTVPKTVTAAGAETQIVWDPTFQWHPDNVQSHFGKGHSDAVDLLATVDIILKCIETPKFETDTIVFKAGTTTDNNKVEVNFRWHVFENNSAFGRLFDEQCKGTKEECNRKAELEKTCDYDFSAMIRAEDGYITAGGRGLTRIVVRIFTKPDCTMVSNPDDWEDTCIFYDQGLVFQRTFLQEPTLLSPIKDIEGATTGCVGKNYHNEVEPYANDAACEYNNQPDPDRTQGYTRGQAVEMHSTMKYVYSGSAKYGEYRKLEVFNGIDARVEFTATNLPNGMVMDKATGKITGVLDADGDLTMKIEANAIDDSCENGCDPLQTLIVADYTFVGAPKLFQSGQVGLAATVGNYYEGGIPKIVGGERRAGLRFEAVNGTVPDGLEIDGKTGQLKGTPRKATSDEVTILYTCTDSNEYAVDLRTLGITIREAITATWPFLLPIGVVNNQFPDYDVRTIETDLSQPSYRYVEVRRLVATSGAGFTKLTGTDEKGEEVAAIPDGLNFNIGTGDFYGTPQKAGDYRIKIQVQDRLGSKTFLNYTEANEGFLKLTIAECTAAFNCNGQGTCSHGTDLYDGEFTCDCSDGFKNGDGDDLEILFCGTVIDNSSKALGAVVGTVIVLGLIAFALYKYRVYHISMRAVDFEAELRKMLDTGEIDEAGIGLAGFPREIKRKDVAMIEMVGQGQFGEVFKGELDESRSGGVPGYMVAVKTSKENTGEGAEEMIREASVMAQLTGNKNLVSLIGVVTSGVPLLLVISLCEYGSLLSYLRLRVLDGEEHMTDGEKLGYCYDMACGMAHVSSKKFVHRDIAARNVLVTSARVCQIADFGLCRAVGGGDATGGVAGDAKDDYYKSQKGVFPVRWTSPEAMETLKFTAASDVWAWGVTVCEIFQDGEKPYSDMNNAAVITELMSGFRHPCPKGCPPALYDMMLMCWKEEPIERPTFEYLANLLQTMFDRDNLTMGAGMKFEIPASDVYGLDGDAPRMVDDTYNIGGDGAAPEEESSYNIGGDGASSLPAAGVAETNMDRTDGYADMGGPEGPDPATSGLYADMGSAMAAMAETSEATSAPPIVFTKTVSASSWRGKQGKQINIDAIGLLDDTYEI